MSRRFAVFFLLAVLVGGHLFLLDKATNSQRQLLTTGGRTAVLPGPLMKISSLEFDGLVANFLFLKAMVFIGETLDRPESPRVQYREYLWLLRLLKTITDLDPYFYDPYYFGNAHLVWNEYSQGKYHPASEGYYYMQDFLLRENINLVDKGIRYRTWDWYLLFLNGFNYFYFLGENEKASEYLMEASRKTNSSPLLATLAARLAHQGDRTENAIEFLHEMIDATEEQSVRETFFLRLSALKKVLYLERAVAEFISRHNRQPTALHELVKYSIIQEIPSDPYGGVFFLDEDGKIKTTSNFVNQ
ncbi:hypothetical protein [Geoalkalibacter sp.]|uniref:hypothetical protein n=1 Tax=Geoalkalibacter sp. TaxID=3041440 RepID=UPI00272DD4D9|nr:hypothetical protein [Geoalkalibacter sp.]